MGSRSRVLVLAIDPDPDGGTWVLLDSNGRNHGDFGLQASMDELWQPLHGPDAVVVEGVQSYGMPVGASVFETVKNIGSIRQIVGGISRVEFDDTLTRPQIKSALCHKANATDANVNAALYDLYGDGTRSSCVGRKDAPGPLYGFKADLWAALALGVVWLGKRGLGPLAARDGLRESELVR